MQLADARVLLTGATGGLGRALAAELARRGSRLVLTGRSRESLEELRQQHGGEPVTVCLDLEQPDAVERLLAAVGPLDGFISAAGLPASGWLEEYRPAQLSRALRVNLEAPMLIALGLIPSMRERRHGHLCFISSLAGKVPSPGLSIYCASKFGLRGFALALATELAGTGVESSVVLPGYLTDAGMFAAAGAKTPPVVGGSSAREVAEKVCDGIAAGRIETVAAPAQHRLIAHALASAPQRSMRALSGKEAVRTAREISAGQRRMR